MAAAEASLVQVSRCTPQIADDVLGIDQNVEQVRHRRALIAADVADAGLQ
jgi:hypothetical protein